MTKLKTILITGSGSGIGKDAAITLAQKGHTIIATTHKKNDADSLNDFAKKSNIPLKSFVLDITKPADREKILNYDVDVLINNAALGQSGSLAEIDIEKIKDTFEVNLFSTLSLTQLALKKMIKNDKGTVIFVSSVAGRIPTPFLGPYSMTKFALSCAGATLRDELHKISNTIHIALIEPGAYATGFNQKMIASKFKWMDTNSYFYSLKDKLAHQEYSFFSYAEQKTTDSIVKKIIKAVEADKPKLRYTAPWWQGLYVSIRRMLGA